MATTRSFSEMLNEYLHYDLLMEELTKRNFFINKVEKDNNWRSGPLIVPFKGASASSMRYGKLTHQDDISENEYVRGKVDEIKEIWGSMLWHARDLTEHDGKISEASFLRNLPDQITDFIEDMKCAVSVNLLTGTHFAKLTAPGTAVGELVVDRPERFTLKQKVTVDVAAGGTPVSGYVRSIDINTYTVVVYNARTGGAPIDFTAAPYVAGDKIFVDGADDPTKAFTPLKDQLLSFANGGSQNLFGKLKTAYPYLQAPNIPGVGFTAATLLDDLFDAWTKIKQLGKGSASELIMSYKHLGIILKALEAQTGAYKNVETKATLYGWTEVIISGVKGSLKVIGVHEMDDDIIFVMDWNALKLHSNKFFNRQKTPEGLEYYTIRTEDGYKYISDTSFYGELVVNKPTACGIIHGINI